jgi:hypothetical protein
MKNRIFLAISIIAISIFIYQGCNLKESKTDGTPPVPQVNEKTFTHNQKSFDNEMAPKDVSGTINRQITNSIDKEPNEQNINNTQDKRMIIRSGSLSEEVDKYDETEVKIKDITKKYSGYVTNSNASLNANGKKQGTITLRFPSDKFDAALIEIRQTGKVMNENISGKDVTEEYMDSEARLKTQRQLEDRLLKLLSEKTARLTDVVEVEQKLSGVRENIEKTEGKMKFLRDQTSYSTLAISVYEPSLLTTSTGGGFFYEIEQSFKRGLNGFTAILTGIITVVIALLPILIIAFVIIYLVMRYFRKRKKTISIPISNPPIAEKSI